MVKISKTKHVTKKGVFKKNPAKSKQITIFSRYYKDARVLEDEETEMMTKKQFDKRVTLPENHDFDWAEGLLFEKFYE